MSLEPFASLINPTRQQLRQLDGLWYEASAAERADFVAGRLALLATEGGKQHHFARPAVTSGYTGGYPRHYTWGPCYGAMWRHNVWLTFHPYGFQRTIYVKLSNKPRKFYLNHTENLDFVSFNVQDLAGSIKQLEMFNETKNILFILPSYLQFLADAGVSLDALDPRRYMIYATGEPSPPALREYYRAQGFRYVDAMRSWMGGMTFITCQFNQRHVIDYLSELKVSATGDVLATDLWNLSQPFIDHVTHDNVAWRRSPQRCTCGRPIDDIEFTARNPTLYIKGRPWPYQEISGVVGSVFKRFNVPLLGRTFSLEGETLVVKLVSDRPLPEIAFVQQRLEAFFSLPVRIEETVDASHFKVAAIRTPAP